MCALEGGTGKRQSVFRYQVVRNSFGKTTKKGDNSVVSPARQDAAARRARRKKEGRKIVMASDWKLGVWPLLVTFPCHVGWINFRYFWVKSKISEHPVLLGVGTCWYMSWSCICGQMGWRQFVEFTNGCSRHACDRQSNLI